MYMLSPHITYASSKSGGATTLCKYRTCFVKIPKFKHSIAAHCVRQATKRKGSQREDPVRHQEEQERNAVARQQVWDNPETRMAT